MLPEFYLNHLQNRLKQAQIITLEILVWLLQVHRDVRIEKLASHYPLPIKQESRRRHLQRFLALPDLSIPLVWFPLIKQIIQENCPQHKPLYLALDRTQWKDKNLFMVAVIHKKRALPIYWQFLPKKGASNFQEQKAILKAVLKLLKRYQLIVLGDREFHSIDLANWLQRRKVGFVLRQKKDRQIKEKLWTSQSLNAFEFSPGQSHFFSKVGVGKKGFGQFNLAVKWKRKYRGKVEKEPWYLLTNLPDLSSTVKAYQKRMGIEAMFKHCKSGGYNLEGSSASIKRLTNLVLLIAIAYTLSTLKGKSLLRRGQKEYVSRLRKVKQVMTKNSKFLLGLYGQVWIITQGFVQDWVKKLMRLNRNKLPFYQRGLRAMELIQQGL
jgi:hypothetical protein